jgi:flagellar FliL protein
MADEDKTVVEVEGEESASDSAPAKGGMKKYAIYGGMLVLIVVAAYALTLFVVKPMLSSDSKSGTEAVEETAQADEGHEQGTDHGDSKETGHGPESADDIFLVKDIIVNPAGTGGTRYLSAAVGFEVKSAATNSKLKAKEAVIRDALIMILSSQTIPQLTDYKNRERIRNTIEKRVEKLLATQDIEAVYFTEFVLQ